MGIINVRSIASYNGHSISANGTVNLKLKFRYSEMVNYIKLVQMLNYDVKTTIKIGNDKPEQIGSFMIKGLNIDHDGEGALTLTSMAECVELDKVNNLTMLERGAEFKTQFSCVNEEDEGEDDSE